MKQVHLIKYYIYIYIIYILLFLFFYEVRGAKMQEWVINSQFLLALGLFMLYYVVRCSNILVACVSVFAFSLLSLFSLSYAFDVNGMAPFGPNMADCLTYRNYASRTSEMTFNRATEFILHQDNESWDDLGMHHIARFCYIIGGSSSGYVNTLLVLNALFLVGTLFFISKIGEQLFSRVETKDLCALFIATGAFYMFAATGLKENFFIFFIVASIFYVVRLFNSNFRHGWIGLLIFLPFVSFFRLAVVVQIVIALLGAMFLRNKKYKFLYLLIFLVTFIIVAINYIDVIIEALGGGNLDSWITYAEARNTGSSVFFQYFSEFVFSFIGNPPLFTGELDFVNFIPFSACVRCFLCPFFVYGLIRAFREDNAVMLFMAFYWLIGTFMLIVVLRGADFRYSSMYYVPFLAMAIMGMHRKKTIWYEKLIMLLVYATVVVVTVGWNL